MRSQLIRILLALSFVLLPLQMTQADVPRLINYQGRLSASGTPLSGTYTVTFLLYDAPENGTALWSETHEVEVTEGVFNVLLGSQAAIPTDIFVNETDLYLGVRVAGEAELTPRQRLASTPFSFQAASADAVRPGAVNTAAIADGAVTAGKLAPGALVTSVNGAAGEVTVDGAGGISVVTSGNSITITGDGGGGGGSAGVQAIQNSDNAFSITNPIGPTVTLNVRDGGIAANMMADDAVTSAAVADGGIEAVDLAETAAVKQLNGLSGPVTIAGTGGATVTSSGNTITINAGSGGGASGVQGIQNTDGFLQITDPNGPTVTVDVQNGAVSTDMISDAAVTAEKIANLTISGDKLANSSVTSSKIADGTIQSADLAASASVRTLNTLAGDVTLAATGDASIARSGNTLTIDVSRPAAGGIQTIQSTDGALAVSGSTGPTTSLAVSAGGIKSNMIADAAITSVKIAPNVVSASHLANNSVLSTALADDAVTNAKLANQSVSAGKIQDDAVDGAKIADGTVTGADVQDGSLSGADVADGTITSADLDANAAVTTINGRNGDITVRGSGGASVTTVGDTLVISSAVIGTAGGIQTLQASDSAILIGNPSGPTTNIGIQSGGITNTMLASGAVTSTNIQDDTIVSADIGTGAVGSDEIVDGSVTSADLDPSAAVTSLEGLTGSISLQGGGGVAISVSPGSNTILITSASSSSIRWKEDVETLGGALDLVEQMRGVRYVWKESGVSDIGFIAEEIGQVLPEVVTFEENGVDARTVDYARVVSVLVEAMKEQQRQIEQQDEALARLEARLVRLESDATAAATDR